MSWGDGTGVPTSGRNLVVVGTDNNGLLHIRIFDATGNRIKDTDETQLPAQAAAISTLKQRLPGLLPPHALTDAEKAQVITEVTSIVGQTHLVCFAQGPQFPSPWILAGFDVKDGQGPERTQVYPYNRRYRHWGQCLLDLDGHPLELLSTENNRLDVLNTKSVVRFNIEPKDRDEIDALGLAAKRTDRDQATGVDRLPRILRRFAGAAG